MRRRKFLGLLGAAAAAWPVVSRAQQPRHARRIGVLMGSERSDPQMRARVDALTEGLQKFGWIIGTDLQVDVAWYGGSVDRATKDGTDFVDGHVDLLVVNGT